MQEYLCKKSNVFACAMRGVFYQSMFSTQSKIKKSARSAFPVEMQRIEGRDLRPSIGKGGSHSNGGFVIMLTARGDSEKVQPLRPILVSAMLEPDLYIIAVRL